MSEVKVNKVSPRSGTDVTVGGKLITESNGDLNLYPNGTGAVEIGGNTNPGTIILNCESNSHGIKLQSPAHSAGQSYTMKFPTGNITAGKFLKVDSVSGSGATGVGQLSFDDAGGGKILQFVVNNDNTNTSNTSSSTYVAATGVDLDITPTSASSKIFIEFNVCVYQTIASGSQDSSFQYELYRDTTLIHTNGGVQYYTSAGWSGNIRYMRYFSRLDTPSTTSAINYNFKFRNPHNSGSIQINNGSMYSDIRAMEIAG